MNHDAQITRESNGWTSGPRGTTLPNPSTVADWLLRVVDAGLCAVICVTPFVFGGRHDFGRLVLVATIAVTAAAWFARQAMLPRAVWTRSAAHWLLLSALVLLLAQVVPLPATVISLVSPRTAELLPLWTSSGGAGSLGTWNTLSLAPHATVKSLAMLVSYGLLFLVVAGRVQNLADARRLLRMVAVASVMMAVFGLVQFFTSDGRFFWFYEHPYRSTQLRLCGAFINRNHFASFLVLGVGPLAFWVWELTAGDGARVAARRPAVGRMSAWLVSAGFVVVVCAVLGSLSRGGAVALLTASTVLAAIAWRRRIVDSRCMYAIAGLAAVVIALLSIYGYDQVVERLDDFTQGSIDAMDQHEGRRRVWAANAAAVQAGWLAGSGAGTHVEICPVYLNESLTWEYTHAECGYLQVATENGIVGELLLLAGIGLCGWWCAECFRRAKSAAEVLVFAACAAGLAASAVHSLIDFVWYIPACMSVAVVLAACVLRMGQLSREAGDKRPAVGRVAWPRARWIEAAVAVSLAGVWTVYTFVGPGVASIYWDRYLRAAIAGQHAAGEQLGGWIEDQTTAPAAALEPHNEVVLRQLERTVAWDPQFARAQVRLAAAYIAEFERRQLASENAMTLPQIRDAALASRFASNAELRVWMMRAIGENVAILARAESAAKRAIALCPLQGEGYVLLGGLCFLDSQPPEAVDAYFDQAERVRPHDGAVLYEIGKERFLGGHLAAALATWQKCFTDRGPHQLKIVYLLAGRIPARMFLDKFAPDWQVMTPVWTRYRLLGERQDLEELIVYATAGAVRETANESGLGPMKIWYALAGMYANLDRLDESLACLERAYACNPRHYGVRHALGQALLSAGRYSEAEAHVRWCLARRPEQKALSEALVLIAKQQMAARESAAGGVQRASFERTP